jgi:MSHA biogenesis protein MshJ
MNSKLKQYAQRFDAQTIRERGLIAISIIVAFSFLWWTNYATPKMKQIETLQTENQRVARDVENTRVIVSDIRQSIAAGVHKEKEFQLTKLGKDLAALEEKLRVTTIELVDPEKMFQLMNQLIYQDSRLRLLSLKRREVRPAIPPVNEEDTSDSGIYRHVLEIELGGKYLDILKYMQTLEALDWKLLWDEIEIVSDEQLKPTVKVVISTLSTRKEWVGI